MTDTYVSSSSGGGWVSVHFRNQAKHTVSTVIPNDKGIQPVSHRNALREGQREEYSRFRHY